MLKLIGITKDYPLGNNEKAVALKGIDVEFRRKEFVSILGPSGCGKTTLLNIIGGLDRYTTGDLFINGVSTKQYKDKDWDTYRNHSIGFVFQTYNLIMHLTVVENVELALTLVGVDRKERHERARQALEAVGLKGQENKRPNQLSGGQMQRVAIARAIINNPDILLADEPTGALDTETSVQIMDILKALSRDRLVLMVTHNPDLAEQYSTRIVRLLDGKVVGDTNPFTEEDADEEAASAQPVVAEEEPVQEAAEEEVAVGESAEEASAKAPSTGKSRRHKERKHTSMSYKSALLLSGKNLLTKRARTTLTAIAGSIGIIGIAIVLALSGGFSSYVRTTAENSLSQYPLTIQGNNVSVSSIVSIFMSSAMQDRGYVAYPDDGEIGMNPILGTVLSDLDNIMGKNDVKGLKRYLDQNFDETWGTVKYDYDLTMHIYTDFAGTSSLHYYKINPFASRVVDQISAVKDVAGGEIGEMLGGSTNDLANLLKQYSGMFSVWDELSPNQALLDSQYELVGGHWPTKPTEVVLVVDKYNHIDDYMAFALGLANPNDAAGVLISGLDADNPDANPLNNWTFSAQEIMDTLHYQLMLESDYYYLNMETGEWEFTPYRHLEDDNSDAIKRIVEPTIDGEVNPDCRAVTLNVSGIIRMRDGVTAGSINGAIAYPKSLIQYMITEAQKGDVLYAHRAIAEIYQGKTAGKVEKIEYSMSGDESAWYDRTPLGTVEYYYDGEYHEEPRYTPVAGVSEETLRKLVVGGTGIVAVHDWDAAKNGGSYSNINTKDLKYYKLTGAHTALGNDDDVECYGIKEGSLGVVTQDIYQTWLHRLGYAVEEDPASISIYASSFENKDKILALLDGYADVEGGSKLHYNDTVGALMSGITLIIKAITYVLIAFSSISLVVSSIMIAIITYTSVMERTKEIGILRSIGARKRDITRVFNSETFIIGLMSGLIASLFTWVMSFPVNAILYGYTNISNLAVVAWWHPVLLVGLSVLLTAIAGFIPSRMAAKKDPVLALRSE